MRRSWPSHAENSPDHGQITDAVSIRERPCCRSGGPCCAGLDKQRETLLFGSNNSQIVTTGRTVIPAVVPARGDEQRSQQTPKLVINALIKQAKTVTAGTLQVTDLGSQGKAVLADHTTLHSGHRKSKSIFVIHKVPEQRGSIRKHQCGRLSATILSEGDGSESNGSPEQTKRRSEDDLTKDREKLLNWRNKPARTI